MPIQVERATRAIQHELGTSLSSGLTALEVVEMAYSALFEAKEGWFWAMRTVYLDTVADSKIIRLPDDYANMYRPAGGDHRIRVLNDREFFKLKEAGVVQSANTYIARQVEDDEGWYLEFVEEFSTAETEKFWIHYEAGPVPVTDGEQTLPLPMYMHKLFLTMTRALARGFEESDELSVEHLLERVMRGPIYDLAVRADIRRRPKGIDKAAQRIKRIGRWDFGDGVLSVISPDGTEHWPS